MISMQTIFEIHRLKAIGYSKRAIAERLNIDPKTVRTYLENPEKKACKRKRRPSKLEPYYDLINELVKEDPEINAPVVLQRIQDKGFDGEITILRLYLQTIRRKNITRQSFIRFESKPGEQMQVDWGHFGVLDYNGHRRKLYALAIIESHSRMIYVFFTHSQKQEVLHQGLYNAFVYFGGCPKELVVDNMLTAVTERVGKIIRFNDAFLKFLLPFGISPLACNIKAPHEKGKVEAAIKYLRNNFMPARTFVDLHDVQSQVRAWLDNVANTRVHQTTGKKPVDCLVKDNLTPLPESVPDLREIGTYQVHKDFSVRFDGNVYTVPPWAVGKRVVVKANQDSVSIFYRERKLASHRRSFERFCRIEHPEHTKQVKKLRNKQHMDQNAKVFLSLGKPAYDFMEKLADNRLSLKKTISALLSLKDEYGDESLVYAMNKAIEKGLYGADYVENILYQEMTPKTNHPQVKLKKQELNDIRLSSPALEEYDVIALKRRRKNHGKSH